MPFNLDAFAQENGYVWRKVCSATGPESVADKGNTKKNCSPEIFCSIELLADTYINKKIRSLKMQQRQIFDYVHSWANAYMKH